ncbi:uncharacterized protein LOC142583085 [Dermacentor variabilis]|uniref:uncharacterized protein LOC142583085 n=1 Tax=Dermacentor variabilis TaxID=34621 RepID=UPI003F5CB313
MATTTAAAGVTTSPCKGKLDFDRPCSAALPDKRCWLNSKLTQWNQVLQGLVYELVEAPRGSLRLSSLSNMTIVEDPDVVSRDAAFFVTRLLERHSCIEELSVCYAHDAYESGDQTTYAINLRPSSPAPEAAVRVMRSLSVHKISFDEARRKGKLHTIEGFDSLCSVQKLYVYGEGDEKFTAELGTMLQRNRNTIKDFSCVFRRYPLNFTKAVACLTSCDSLSLGTANDIEDSVTGAHFVRQILEVSAVLNGLTINIPEREISTLAEVVMRSKALTTLEVELDDSSPTPLFAALEKNTTLRELHVIFAKILPHCEQTLASALRKNVSLKQLELYDFQTDCGLTNFAKALSQNSSLERVELTSRSLRMREISVICDALVTNKTLKELSLSPDCALKAEERVALAEQLTRNGSYNRVQLPWVEADLPGLSTALLSLSTCPQELHLNETTQLSEATMSSLCDTIAQSYVRSLDLALGVRIDTNAASICEMLKSSRRLLYLRLHCPQPFAQYALHALAENRCLDGLSIEIYGKVTNNTAEAIAFFLTRNETVTRVDMTHTRCVTTHQMEEIYRGMSNNRRITYYDLPFRFRSDCSISFDVLEKLRRNRSTLYRAVEFAEHPVLDKQSAEAFELFFNNPGFRRELVEVTGRTEAEVMPLLKSAQNYLRDNYLVLTGVVRQDVLECHPRGVTQADALNKDCWRAIARYLRVSDVVTPRA